jgi:DNA-binding CsgD family transcriptional regulator
VQARVDIGLPGSDAHGVLQRLFDTHIVVARYMLDHLDQVGRSCVTVARTAPHAAPEALDRFMGWVGDDPDGVGIAAHLAAIVSEHRDEHAAAIDGYLRSLVGPPLGPATVAADAMRGLARCAEMCGDRAGARRWAAGAVATLAGWPGPALDESVRLLRQLGGRPPRSGASAVLTDRELEVALLVSRGLTNVQIGRQLIISSRTVGVHVRHILDKIGAANRAEIAAYVVRAQLVS